MGQKDCFYMLLDNCVKMCGLECISCSPDPLPVKQLQASVVEQVS